MSPYYSEGGITIYHGDCREVLPSLDSQVDLVLTDPPYPGYEKGWEVPDVPLILSLICAKTFVVFWPPLLNPPIQGIVAEHIWHKPNGNSSHHYERIFVSGEAPKGCKVHRVAAILPNYTQYQREDVGHPCQKPLALISRLLASHKGRVVMDPFMGSGTTLVAAKVDGRRAIGIEVNERWCAVAARRLSQGVLDFAGGAA